MGSPVAAAFLEALAPEGERLDPAAVQAALAEVEAAARAQHPTAGLGAERFAALLGGRCRGADPLAKLRSLHAADLLLVWSALEGDGPAQKALDALLGRAARQTSRVRGAAPFVDEVHQQLRERFLIPAADGHMRLAEYLGVGSLESWCRVAATRLALRLAQAVRREVTLEPAILEGGSKVTGLETDAHRRQHAAAISAAFQDAIRGLAQDDRVLLRYHFVDGLNFEEIAALFQSHRSTISRRVAAARQRLLEATESGLRERIGANTQELPALLKAVHSQVEGDLSVWLNATARTQ